MARLLSQVRLRHVCWLVIVACVVVLACQFSHAANLVTNGSFENGLTGWTQDPTNSWYTGVIDARTVALCDPLADTTAWISPIAEFPAGDWVVSFDAAGWNVGAGGCSMLVTLGYKSSGWVVSQEEWTRYALGFASLEPWTLRIAVWGQGDDALLLDGVVVEPVGELGGAWVLCCGVAFLGVRAGIRPKPG